MDVLQIYDKQIVELAKGKREEFSLYEFICDLLKEQKRINKKLKDLKDKEDLSPADKLMIITFECQLKQLNTSLDMCGTWYPKKFPMY